MALWGGPGPLAPWGAPLGSLGGQPKVALLWVQIPTSYYLRGGPRLLYPPSQIEWLNSFGRILWIPSVETRVSWSGLGAELSVDFPIHSSISGDSLLCTRSYAKL